MKSRAILTVVLLCLSVPMIVGQDVASTANDVPSSREDILKLFEVMQVRSQMSATMNQIMLQMRSMNRTEMKKQNPAITDEELAKIDAKGDELIKGMPLDGLLDDMIPVYQKHLSKSDVDAMIAFYATPTGQKLLHEMPAIAAEGMQAMQPRMLKQMDEIRRKAEEEAKGGAKQNPTGAPNPK